MESPGTEDAWSEIEYAGGCGRCAGLIHGYACLPGQRRRFRPNCRAGIMFWGCSRCAGPVLGRLVGSVSATRYVLIGEILIAGYMIFYANYCIYDSSRGGGARHDLAGAHARHRRPGLAASVAGCRCGHLLVAGGALSRLGRTRGRVVLGPGSGGGVLSADVSFDGYALPGNRRSEPGAHHPLHSCDASGVYGPARQTRVVGRRFFLSFVGGWDRSACRTCWRR